MRSVPRLLRGAGLLGLILFSLSCIPQTQEVPTPTPTPILTLKTPAVLEAWPAQVRGGEEITVRYSGAPGNSRDWIAISPVHASSQQSGQYHYLLRQKEGTLTFTAPAVPGEYEFRLFAHWPDGGYGDLARSNAVQVIAAFPTSTPAPTPTVTSTPTPPPTPTSTPFVISGVRSTTITLVAVEDTYVSQDQPSSNFGSAGYLKVSINGRTFVRFDLSPLPPGATVSLAKLEINMYEAPTQDRIYELHAVTEAWSEATITWRSQPAVSQTSATHALSIGTRSDVVLIWGLTEEVQAMVAGSRPNYGWRIKDTREAPVSAQESQFRSRESYNRAQRPRLVISYVPAQTPGP